MNRLADIFQKGGPFFIVNTVMMAVIIAVIGVGSWLGFLGISYVTFRALDVVIGIQDRLQRSQDRVGCHKKFSLPRA